MGSGNLLNLETDLEIHIGSYTGENVRVTVDAPAWDSVPVFDPITSVVSDRRTAVVTVPRELRMMGSEKHRKAIRIEASADVVVYVLSDQTVACAGYMAHPVESLGTDYYAVTFWPNSPRREDYSQIAVASRDDANVVTLTFPMNRGIEINYEGTIYRGGDQLSVQLESYEVLQIQENVFNDLSGTHIESLFPVAVVSGNTHTNTLYGSTLDMVAEQLPSVSKLSSMYVVSTMFSGGVGDIVKVVATEPDTVVRVDGYYSDIILETGGDHQVLEPLTQQITQISSNKPIIVAQFMRTMVGVDPGPPSMMIVPPLEQFISSYRFIVPRDYIESYLLLIASHTIISGLTIDDNPIVTTGWIRMPSNQDLAVKTIDVSPGVHSVSHVDDQQTFGAFVYGVTRGECSYSYPAGQCLDNLTGVRTNIIINKIHLNRPYDKCRILYCYYIVAILQFSIFYNNYAQLYINIICLLHYRLIHIS